jgi:hypothetical protein
MATVRRWYFYLVCLVTLQLAAWTTIALLRRVLVPPVERNVELIAFQVAALIIGLPFFLAHWLWIQRRVAQDVEERQSALRHFFLYAVLAAFLVPFVANGYQLLLLFWQLLLGVAAPLNLSVALALQPGLVTLIHSLVALLITAVLWFYFERIRRADETAVAETGSQSFMRQAYIYLFSTAGLALLLAAMISLLRWLIYQLGSQTVSGGGQAVAQAIAQLLTGLALWLIFWGWAQRLYHQGEMVERTAVLRKLYLYGFLFVAVLTTVTAAALILTGLFRRLLELPPGGDIGGPLPVILVMGGLWAYHTYLLQQETELSAETQPASVRRLYYYLLAAIGLAVLVGGVATNLTVLIWAFSGFFGEMREGVAAGSAAIVAGLPVWLLPWRRVQAAAELPGAEGAPERRSLARKIYLYFYLFVATMTMLGSLVFIISRLVMALLREPGTDYLLTEIANALAFSLLAAAVWAYHGLLLRHEQRLLPAVQRLPGRALRVAVLDVGDGRLGQSLVTELQRQLPELVIRPFGLTPDAATALEVPVAQPDMATALAESELIVGPWEIAVAGTAGGAVSPEVAGAVTASPAHKMLIPLPQEGWSWSGVDGLSREEAVRQTVQAVKQLVDVADGEGKRPLSVGHIILIVLAVFLFLPLLLQLVLFLLFGPL